MIETILAEEPARHAEGIEALYDLTFGPGHFAKTAERLREYNRSVTELNRVAINDKGQVVGVVRVWPILVEQGGPALFVGPVAIHPAYRGERLGLKLCSLALDAGRERAWQGAIIIGSPDYFSPLGFRPVQPDQLLFPGPQDMSRVMTLDLSQEPCRYSGRIIPYRMYGYGGQFA
jgi:predicted N-acetyltransferase YhbS